MFVCFFVWTYVDFVVENDEATEKSGQVSHFVWVNSKWPDFGFIADVKNLLLWTEFYFSEIQFKLIHP
jgi:hypothetical protein